MVSVGAHEVQELQTNVGVFCNGVLRFDGERFLGYDHPEAIS